MQNYSRKDAKVAKPRLSLMDIIINVRGYAKITDALKLVKSALEKLPTSYVKPSCKNVKLHDKPY